MRAANGTSSRSTRSSTIRRRWSASHDPAHRRRGHHRRAPRPALGGPRRRGPGPQPIAGDPPPCLWEPFGNAVTGSRRVASQAALLAVLPASNPLGLADAVNEAKHLLSIHAPPSAGTWYVLPVNPAASPAG